MVMESVSFSHTFASFARTHVGNVRTHNEDAILDLSKNGVWVVADGMGGHSAGNIASQIVVDTIQQCAEQNVILNIEVLREALFQANKQVVDYSQTYLNGKTTGSTVVVLYIHNNSFHCLWAGDSRMYLSRHGALAQKTRDHSQVMDMFEQGLISESEVETHPQANVITRAVGVHSELDIDYVSGPLSDGDIFLLCSDGLTKELTSCEIEKCLQAENVLDSGQALMHSVLVKGASDNVSCILVKVGQCDSSVFDNDDTVPIFTNRR